MYFSFDPVSVTCTVVEEGWGEAVLCTDADRMQNGKPRGFVVAVVVMWGGGGGGGKRQEKPCLLSFLFYNYRCLLV